MTKLLEFIRLTYCEDKGRLKDYEVLTELVCLEFVIIPLNFNIFISILIMSLLDLQSLATKTYRRPKFVYSRSRHIHVYLKLIKRWLVNANNPKLDWYLQLLQTFAQEVLTHIDLCSPLLSPRRSWFLKNAHSNKKVWNWIFVSQDLNVLCGQRFCELSESFDVHGDQVGGELVLGDVQERAVVRVVHVNLK